MNLTQAFQYQLENTRTLIEEDLKADTGGPVVWNGVIFRPDGNFYSSGKEMKVGDLFLIGYVVKNTASPVPILIEASEIEQYESVFNVIRVVEHVPVLTHKDQSSDQYARTADDDGMSGPVNLDIFYPAN